VPCAPLVVTLQLDEPAQARFDALRTAHFPPERLVVGAHVTLFHALPGDRLDEVLDVLAAAAERPGFAVTVDRVRSLGRGVAFDLSAAPLAALHAVLQRRLPVRTAQDRQPLNAHVTVQNKVEPQRARALLAALAADFVPYEVPARGLRLWRYLGGPWEPVQALPFAEVAA
jgi:2'-5' RNA ligase